MTRLRRQKMEWLTRGPTIPSDLPRSRTGPTCSAPLNDKRYIRRGETRNRACGSLRSPYSTTAVAYLYGNLCDFNAAAIALSGSETLDLVHAVKLNRCNNSLPFSTI